MWMPGALLLSVVYQHSPWIHKQFHRGEVVFSGSVYVKGGSPTLWVNEVFILFFSKHIGFSC